MRKDEWLWMLDDDPIVLFGLRKMLQSEFPGLHIEAFSNGEPALEALEELQSAGKSLPALILLDLNMPIMDGWQFLEAIHQKTIDQKLHIAIITSSIDPADHNRYIKYKHLSPHRIDYLSKPVPRSELARLVHSC